MSSSSFHRVITGHSTNGKAIVTHDDVLHPVNFFDSSVLASPTDFGLTLLFRTEAIPTVDNKTTAGQAAISISNTVPVRDPYKTAMPIVEPGHVNWRLIDLPPHSTAPLHRTTSVDFGVVLKGEVVLELDDGVETLLREHDGIVQRGTIHAWHNRTDNIVRMMFVILPSDAVIANDGLALGEVGIEV
jgi:quercetin dioxygenase-like cupin family protein